MIPAIHAAEVWGYPTNLFSWRYLCSIKTVSPPFFNECNENIECKLRVMKSTFYVYVAISAIPSSAPASILGYPRTISDKGLSHKTFQTDCVDENYYVPLHNPPYLQQVGRISDKHDHEDYQRRKDRE